MLLDEMKEIKEERGYTCEWLASRSGLPVSTVRKIFGGVTEHPRRKSLAALEQVYLEEDALINLTHHMIEEKIQTDYHLSDIGNQEKGKYKFEIEKQKAKLPKINSGGLVYGTAAAERLYTIDDLEAMPDEPRYELIDGRLYLMAAPTKRHQILLGDIFAQIYNYIKRKGKDCTPYLAPTDVHLMPDDDMTMVQPDIIVVCESDKETHPRIVEGAPEWVIEILSPSSRKKDMQIKKHKYERAGVKEYWMVDPDGEVVITIEFGSTTGTHIYSFGDPMPVALTDGDLVIEIR